MEYGYLRAFIMVGKHLNFTRAGEEMGLTQAAISRQIRKLEESVGEQLVIRSPQQVKLTDRGKELLQRAGIFHHYVSQEFRKEEKNHLGIGIIQGVLHSWLTGFLASHFSDLKYHFDIIVDSTANLKTMLEESRIDVLISGEKIETGILTSRKLFDEQYVLISKSKMDVLNICDYRWIVHGKTDPLFNYQKKKSENIITVNSILAIIQLVELGMGIAAVPSHAISGNKKLVVQDIQKMKKRAVYLTTLNYELPPKMLKEFYKAI